jgi:2-polyprenyl-3-methyl-5-hydroxy-6-metoxy-1,4-benzoquinol methylase
VTSHWQTDDTGVRYLHGGAVLFEDTLDHWQNAILRLLALDDANARCWVETVITSAPRSWAESDDLTRASAIAAGTRKYYGWADVDDWKAAGYTGVDALGATVDRLFIRGIMRDDSVEIVGNSVLGHGILVSRTTRRPLAPPVYEEQYFEGNEHGLGYGNYHGQTDWRMEKSRRYLRQVEGIAWYLGQPARPTTRLLDVGSGYGFFRQAAAERGWQHEGVEISAHATAVARKQFGFDTFVGTLEQFRADRGFTICTLFDVVEHIEQPVEFLRTVATLLNPGGLCVVRTPNLLSFEAEVFGPFYHSLKMEHLQLFSPTSLSHALRLAGMPCMFLASESHLLRGFLGTHLTTIARQQHGSDLFAVAVKA